jgi:small-conductance mechanosensitive channel/CRP-like cAMP-binding protein
MSHLKFLFVADPIYQFAALLVISLVARMMLGRKPAFRFIANLIFFGLLTALLLSNGIEPYAATSAGLDLPHRIFVGVAKAVWWVGGAMVLVSSVRLFLIFEGKPREGRLLQDLIIGIIYLGAALSVTAYVFSVPVGTLIATSGVFAIVLGLALQNTLGDVFSGIALNLGRPYAVGDWIVLEDEVQGRVIETNWRSTHLLNGANDLVIVPNSALAKARITNLTSTDEAHGVSIKVRFVPSKPPAAITELMQTVLLSANCILKSPVPSVLIAGMDSSALELELSFRVGGLATSTAARNEIYDLVYRHALAAGVRLAGPENSIPPGEQASREEAGKHPSTAWRLLNSITLFATLTEDEKEALSTGMNRLTFSKGAVIAPKSTSLTSLMIIRSGVVAIQAEDHGKPVEVTRLAPGDLFGERGVLMGATEPADIKALTFVVVYEISKDHLSAVMRDRPLLAEELGLLLSKRIESERRLAEGMPDGHALHPASLATRIKGLFHIQADGRNHG